MAQNNGVDDSIDKRNNYSERNTNNHFNSDRSNIEIACWIAAAIPRGMA